MNGDPYCPDCRALTGGNCGKHNILIQQVKEATQTDTPTGETEELRKLIYDLRKEVDELKKQQEKNTDNIKKMNWEEQW